MRTGQVYFVRRTHIGQESLRYDPIESRTCDLNDSGASAFLVEEIDPANAHAERGCSSA